MSCRSFSRSYKKTVYAYNGRIQNLSVSPFNGIAPAAELDAEPITYVKRKCDSLPDSTGGESPVKESTMSAYITKRILITWSLFCSRLLS